MLNATRSREARVLIILRNRGDRLSVVAAAMVGVCYVKQNLFNAEPGTASPDEWSKAMDKTIVMSASMGPDALMSAVVAHHKAIGGLTATIHCCPRLTSQK